MKQSTTSTSSAGIAVDSEESKAIDDVTVIEEMNIMNDVVAIIEAPAEDITLDLYSSTLPYFIHRNILLNLYFNFYILLEFISLKNYYSKFNILLCKVNF
jgi:hypothetical protein